MSKYIIKDIHKSKHNLLLSSPPSSFSRVPSSHKPVPSGGFPHKPRTTPSFSDFLKTRLVRLVIRLVRLVRLVSLLIRLVRLLRLLRLVIRLVRLLRLLIRLVRLLRLLIRLAQIAFKSNALGILRPPSLLFSNSLHREISLFSQFFSHGLFNTVSFLAVPFSQFLFSQSLFRTVFSQSPFSPFFTVLYLTVSLLRCRC